jgi:hypothetical protein
MATSLIEHYPVYPGMFWNEMDMVIRALDRHVNHPSTWPGPSVEERAAGVQLLERLRDSRDSGASAGG